MKYVKLVFAGMMLVISVLAYAQNQSYLAINNMTKLDIRPGIEVIINGHHYIIHRYNAHHRFTLKHNFTGQTLTHVILYSSKLNKHAICSFKTNQQLKEFNTLLIHGNWTNGFDCQLIVK